MKEIDGYNIYSYLEHNYTGDKRIIIHLNVENYYNNILYNDNLDPFYSFQENRISYLAHWNCTLIFNESTINYGELSLPMRQEIISVLKKYLSKYELKVKLNQL